VFGDLHVKDIRQWREQSFADCCDALLFPIFDVDYVVLQPVLWNSCDSGSSDGGGVKSSTAASNDTDTISDLNEVRCIKISAWNHSNSTSITGTDSRDVTDASTSTYTTVSSVSVDKQGAAIGLGSVYDAAFVSLLPDEVDKMGEKGEFHTHVVFK
jgi:hypothetical protein